MVDIAFCGCINSTINSSSSSSSSSSSRHAQKKLCCEFFAPQRSLSSSDFLFPSLLLRFPSTSRHGRTKNALRQYRFTAAAEPARSTISAPSSSRKPLPQTRAPPKPQKVKTRPRKGNRIMSKDGRPPPPRHKLLGVRDAILKPPLDDVRLANKFLRSPQLSLKTLPLLSSCLPFASLRAEDEDWMDRHFGEIKEALGYSLGEEIGSNAAEDPLKDSISRYSAGDEDDSLEHSVDRYPSEASGDSFPLHDGSRLSEDVEESMERYSFEGFEDSSENYPLKEDEDFSDNDGDSLEIKDYREEKGHFEPSKQAPAKDLSGSSGNTKISPDSPLFHRDILLFLAFQHPENERGRVKSIKTGHSRLAFLGEYVLELALAEFFLMRYPRESPACLRERIFGLINKKALPRWIRIACLDSGIYPEHLDVRTEARLQNIRGVFWAIVGALYLCMGMSEVYRFLFDVCGFDPDVKDCQPKQRLGREDVDYVFPPLEEKQIEWNDLSKMKTADDELFAKPMLYRACVPPGMKRFRGNLWEIDCLPKVLQIMGYPLPALDRDPAITMARNSELELGLQLCFLHPSMYKSQHPRFCNERFEYLGSKIQDVVMAEKLLMKHLDAPGFFIKEKHRRLLFNRVCGRYLREKTLQKFIVYSEDRKSLFEKARKLRNMATTGVSLALHGLAYTVYGKADVRRVMFEIFDFERLQSDH